MPTELSLDTLGSPIAAVPMPDGTSAWVIDDLGGSWAAGVIELATGERPAGAPEITGKGTPLAFAANRERSRIFVATSATIAAIDVASGARTEFANPFTDGPRALAARDGSRLWMSGDARVARADLRPDGVVVSIVLDNLAEPWGLALDPLDAEHFFVAERGADRILDVDESGPRFSAIAAASDPAEPVPLVPVFPAPGALALDEGGTELLVLCGLPSGAASLRAWSRETRSVSGSTGTFAREVTRELPDPRGQVSAGRDRLVLVAQPSASALWAGGGIEQRREIAAQDGERVIVSTPFAPAPTPSARCRIVDRLGLASTARQEPGSTAPGGAHAFVWDARDWEGGGDVFFRVLCADTDVGLAGEASITTIGQAVFSADDEQVLAGAGSGCAISGVTSLAVADMDADGDLDVVAAVRAFEGASAVVIQHRGDDGELEPCPSVPLRSVVNPNDLALGEIDQDENKRVDLVVASRGDNNGDNNVVVFLNKTNGFLLSQSLPANKPDAVDLVDVTGDGRADLLALQEGTVGAGRGMRLWVGLANGLFQEPGVDLPSIPEPGREFAHGDFDGDGLADLLVAHGTDNHDGALKLYRQRPSHDFEIVFTGPSSLREPRAVALVDLDGDGRLDVVSANETSQNLTVFFQGDTGFASSPSVVLGDASTTKGATALVVADVNRDGLLDLVSADSDEDFGDDGALTAFFQLEPGAFDPIPMVIRRTGFRPIALALGDLESDGDLDLVTGDTTRGTAGLSLFRTRTARDFDASPHQTLLFNEDANPRFVAAGDLDSDGDVDLVANLRDADRIGLFFQEEVGHFSPVPRIELGSTASVDGPRHLLLADMNDDGRLDVLSAQGHQDEGDPAPTSAGAVTLFSQDDSGSFGEPRALAPSSSITESMWIAVGDVDRDGRLDLVSADGRRGDAALFLQGEQGEFPEQPNHRFIGLSDPHGVDLADLRADGNLDVLVADFSANRLVLEYQDPAGGGAFSGAPVTLTANAVKAPSTVQGLDVDLDGALDVVSANSGNQGVVNGSMTVFYGPAFDTPLTLGLRDPQNHAPLGLRVPVLAIAGDLDGDGLPDLAANCEGDPNSFPAQIVVFHQRSPGRFESAPRLIGPLNTDEFIQGLCFSDLDGNGELDLVSANLAGDKLWLFFSSR